MFSKKKKDLPKQNIKNIGSPFGLQHNIHVDSNFNWTGKDPTSNFILENELGEGSFGIVYQAIHKTTNFSLAIKIINMNNDEINETINKEIEILKKCNNNNIVSYFGSFWTNTDLWILMELCEVGSIRDLLEFQNKPFNEKQISYIILNTLKGLDYLHSVNIMHRDIKAANILVTEKGEIKLGDFGVSYQLCTTLFSENVIVGTPLYIAPEAIKHKIYTIKLDIWALGITCIELADGFPPFYELNPMRAMYMIPHKPPPTVSEPKNWSKEFLSFLEKCLQKNPEERPTAKELLNDPFILKAKGSEVLKDLIMDSLKNKKKKIKKVNTKLKNSFKLSTKLSASHNNSSLNENFATFIKNDTQNSISDNCLPSILVKKTTISIATQTDITELNKWVLIEIILIVISFSFLYNLLIFYK